MSRPWRFKGWRGAWAVLLVTGLASGCGRSTGTVTGRVTFNGQPLGSGIVTFYSADGQYQEQGVIDAQGNYTIARAPTGDVTATVQTAPPSPTADKEGPEIKVKGKDVVKPPKDTTVTIGGGGAKAPTGKYVKIPDKYRDPQTSGLKYKVQTGSNEIDIKLQP